MELIQAIVEDKIARWTALGSDRLHDGSLLVGPLPHLGPLAWLHEVYSPLSREAVGRKVDAFPRLGWFPYPEFLVQLNGCHLFSGALWLLGIRTTYTREQTRHLPWDVQNANLNHVTLGLDNDALVVGGATFLEREVLYLQDKSGTVQARDRETSRWIFRWNSMDDFLVTEIDRLAPQFDATGRAKPGCPTADFS